MRVGAALAYLHASRLLHNDIKPDNILLSKPLAEGGSFLLTDFGISTRLRTSVRKSSQGSREVKGMTQAYSAPELFGSQPKHAPATDIFSFGVMLYECCAGTVPWMGMGGLALNSGGAMIPQLPAGYSPALKTLAAACIALDPARRPTAKALAQRKAAPKRPSAAAPKKQPAYAWLWVALFLLLGGGGFWGYERYQKEQAEEARKTELTQKEEERRKAEELARKEAEDARKTELAQKEEERRKADELARKEAEEARKAELARKKAEEKSKAPYTLRAADVTMKGGTITDYKGTKKSIAIPKRIKGTAVTSIGDWAFDKNQLTRVTIPNSVTRIGKWAFYNNQLTRVDIPHSVTSIGLGTFNHNAIAQVNGAPSKGIFYARNADGTEDRTIIVSYGGASTVIDFIPNSVTRIGDWAFVYNQLTSVTIPNSVTSIGDWAFYKNQLTHVTIPNSVTSIGKGAFEDNQLTSVTIPNSVTSIGKGAFEDNQLTRVDIPHSVTSIGKRAFRDNQLTHVTIPNSVTSIGDWAFYKNQLTHVTIPNSVTSIGDWAFEDNQLTRVDIPHSVTSIGKGAFRDNQLTRVTIPNGVTRIGKGAFTANQLTRVTIGNSVTHIGDAAFSLNPNLSSIVLPAPAQRGKVWEDGNGNYYEPGSAITGFYTSYTLINRP